MNGLWPFAIIGAAFITGLIALGIYGIIWLVFLQPSHDLSGSTVTMTSGLDFQKGDVIRLLNLPTGEDELEGQRTMPFVIADLVALCRVAQAARMPISYVDLVEGGVCDTADAHRLHSALAELDALGDQR